MLKVNAVVRNASSANATNSNSNTARNSKLIQNLPDPNKFPNQLIINDQYIDENSYLQCIQTQNTLSLTKKAPRKMLNHTNKTQSPCRRNSIEPWHTDPADNLSVSGKNIQFNLEKPEISKEINDIDIYEDGIKIDCEKPARKKKLSTLELFPYSVKQAYTKKLVPKLLNRRSIDKIDVKDYFK